MSNHSAKFEAVHALLNAGDFAGAKVACQRLVQAAPREPAAQSLMAQILYRLGQPAPALHYASVASQLAPRDPGLLTQWANLLLIAGKHDQALQTLGKIPGLLDTDPYALSLATSAHLDANRCVAALEAATKAHALQPDDPGLTSQLAACYLNIGEASRAFSLIEPYTKSKQTPPSPPSPTMLSGLALISNYVPGISRTEQEALHLAYGQRLAELSPVPTRSFSHLLIPKKKLRVGILSPDLRSHSVASFIEPLFIHHDRERLELVIYQTNAVADDVTKRLRKNIATWHVMDNISDEALAERIYADKIDIAIELSGHTHAHCLPCLHLRPAPLQLTYLGYPNITGLTSMDYRAVDSVTDPVSLDELSQGRTTTGFARRESFTRLDPIFLCYQPPAHAPLPTTARSPDAPITFGSFNNVQKLNDPLIAMWAQILKGVPNSRLLLKGVALTEPALQNLLLKRFTSQGLAPDRIEILARAPTSAAHLALYSRVDIALDTYPYGGTTTTCEALAMGVPVITLSGTQSQSPDKHAVAPHASRVGASILTQMGMSELIASDEQQYIALACSLASDAQRLAALRLSVREKLLASPLCDGPGFAKRFSAHLHSLWEAKLTTSLGR